MVKIFFWNALGTLRAIFRNTGWYIMPVTSKENCLKKMIGGIELCTLMLLQKLLQNVLAVMW